MSATNETPDPKLDAVTEALRAQPLEDRAPGYGGVGLSAWDKAEILAQLDDSRDSDRGHCDWMADDEAYAEAAYWHDED